MIETNTGPEQRGIDSIFSSREQRSFSRFLKRTLGKGFRLSFAQVHTPVARQYVVEWVHQELSSDPVSFFEVDLADLPGDNLWVELGEHLAWQEPPKKAVIFLWGLENTKGSSDERPPMIQQLNVQRDIFVRDFPVIWVLFFHPFTRHRMLQVAPDFCDFATPWLEGLESTARIKAMPMTETYAGNEMIDPKGDFLVSEDLKAAWRLLADWRLDEARDGLAQYDLEPSMEKPWQRDFVWWVYVSRRGYVADAVAGLRSLAESHELTETDLELARTQIRFLEAHTKDQPLSRDLEKDMAFHKKEQAIAEKQGNRATLSISYEQQAEILRDEGKLEEAMALFKKTQAIHEELGNRAGLAACYGEQAVILIGWGKLEEAMVLLKKTQAIHEELGNRDRMARVYYNKAAVLIEWGKLEEALALLKQAQAIFEEVGNRADLANTFWNQGFILAQKGDRAGSFPLLKHAVAIRDELGIPGEDLEAQLAAYETDGGNL